MNTQLSQKSRIAFIGSIVLNIFLIAFLLGRMCMAPPPPFGHPPGEHGDRMPPPPFFSPSGLFTPEEMKADAAKNKQSFDKMNEVRKAFGAKLQQGPVSREEVQEHFAEIDKLMEDLRTSSQSRIIDKITSMSVEERNSFGKKLMQDPPPHFGDYGHGPGEPPPPPPGKDHGAPAPGGEPPPPPSEEQ